MPSFTAATRCASDPAVTAGQPELMRSAACVQHGIGQWKAIRDSEPLLAKRTPGDLKDRFRSVYPHH